MNVSTVMFACIRWAVGIFNATAGGCDCWRQECDSIYTNFQNAVVPTLPVVWIVVELTFYEDFDEYMVDLCDWFLWYLMRLNVWKKEDFIMLLLYYFIQINSRMQNTANSRCK